MLEVQHFLSVKEYSEKCKKEIDTILFFYSNEEDEAENIGKVLDKVKDKREGQVMIYSFDYNLDMEILNLMKNLYGISIPNSLVINEDVVLNNLENIDEIEFYLKEFRAGSVGVLFIN